MAKCQLCGKENLEWNSVDNLECLCEKLTKLIWERTDNGIIQKEVLDKYVLHECDPKDVKKFEKLKTCTYCGEGGLHFEKTGKKWVLCDSRGSKHVCSKEKIKQKEESNNSSLKIIQKDIKCHNCGKTLQKVQTKKGKIFFTDNGTHPHTCSSKKAKNITMPCKKCHKTIKTRFVEGKREFLEEDGTPHVCDFTLTATCPKCGKRGLFWDKTLDGKSFLTSNGRVPHKCKRNQICCKICGKEGLYWATLNGEVFLINKKGIRHICHEN